MKSVSTSGDNIDFIIDYDSLTVGSKIANNNKGELYQAIWFGQNVAMKQLSIKTMSDQSVQKFKQETKQWALLNHPNIMQLFGICTKPYCMIMKYASQGSLEKLLHSPNLLSWSMRLQLAVDICSAILHLHNNNIIHGNLKSSNVLLSTLNERIRAQISDIGISHTKPTQMSSINWMAPEQINKEKLSSKTDIYSLGMILWAIATRSTPYHEKDQALQTLLIKEGITPEIPTTTPAHLTAIIKKCWEKRPANRPTIKSILDQLISYLQDEKLTQTWSTKTDIESTQKALIQSKPNTETQAISGILTTSASSAETEPFTGLLSTRTGRKKPIPLAKRRKLLLQQVYELLDEAYPEEDALEEEEIAKFRNGILAKLLVLKAKKKLTKADQIILIQIKQELCEELEIEFESALPKSTPKS